MNKILVVNGASYFKAVKNLADYSNDIGHFMKKPSDFSLVLFTGGEDISPELYGETSPKGVCSYSIERDIYEKNIFNHAVKHSVKMTGICRGIQFLNVMAGGKMIHHLNAHGGCMHEMSTSREEKVQVNSYHHQMVLPPKDAVIIGWASEIRSNVYIGDKDLEVKPPSKEIEAVIYPNINAAGVQYHPEMMEVTSSGYKWYEQLVNDLMQTESMEELINQYTSTGDQKCNVTMCAV